MIGKRIREARLAKKLSLRELGEAVGVTPQAVAGWEKSNPRFDYDRACIVANVLEVDVDWILGKRGDDDEPIRSRSYVEMEGKTPIIDLNNAIAFMVMAFEDEKRKEFYKGFVVPSAKIVGQTFAVEADESWAEGPIKSGDILIFDNGVRPAHGDICIWIHVGDNQYISTTVGGTAEIRVDGRKGVLCVDLGHSDNPDASVAVRDGASTPVAVMVEHRRFRRASTDG